MSEETYVFTSNEALRRSIRKRHPNLSPEEFDATYNILKKCVGWRKTKDGDWISPSGAVNDKSELDLRNIK